MNFKEWENSDTFQMYHGGRKWSFVPSELIPPKQGRYEGGIGIYFTNYYETARKYAKGNKVVQIADINKNYTDIKDVNIVAQELIDFAKTIRLKNKPQIIQSLINYSTRTKQNEIPAEVFSNLIINFEALSGNASIDVAKYFISKGIDASLQPQKQDEQWLVVLNTSIIKSVKVVNPKDVPSLHPFVLPMS